METKKIRILVIDDEDVIRDFLAEMFVTVGHEADVAATGPEGIAMFEAGQYDVVFSDLGLPDMSGWDVAKSNPGKELRKCRLFCSAVGASSLTMSGSRSAAWTSCFPSRARWMNFINAVDEVVKRQRGKQA